MAKEAVKRFIEETERRPGLKDELEAIPKGGGQWTIGEVVKVAARAGYDFTPRDYEEAVGDLLAQKHAAGVLNDAELAVVTGGLMCVSSDGTYCLCCPVRHPKPGTTHP